MSVNCLASKFIRCSRLMIDAPKQMAENSGAKIRIEVGHRSEMLKLKHKSKFQHEIRLGFRFYPPIFVESSVSVFFCFNQCGNPISQLPSPKSLAKNRTISDFDQRLAFSACGVNFD